MRGRAREWVYEEMERAYSPDVCWGVGFLARWARLQLGAPFGAFVCGALRASRVARVREVLASAERRGLHLAPVFGRARE